MQDTSLQNPLAFFRANRCVPDYFLPFLLCQKSQNCLPALQQSELWLNSFAAMLGLPFILFAGETRKLHVVELLTRRFALIGISRWWVSLCGIESQHGCNHLARSFGLHG
jgi:hypothetical protein